MIESVLEPLFHISSLPKTWTIAEVGTNFVIRNSNLEAESISLYESICDENTGLDFGRCSSARFSFTTLDIDLDLAGKVFDVSFTFEDEPNTPFVVGRFKVVEDKPSPDRRNRDVVMYDALYDVLNTNYASWYNGLTWTGMTLGGFIDSFLSHVGITAETASRAELVNASMTVEETLKTNDLTGSTILHAVCEVAGCFGIMTRDNKFRFLYLKSDIEGLYPANDLYPAEDLYPVEPAGTLIDGSEYFPPLVYETYKAPSISKLFISESADSLGTVVGSGDVEYDIVGNFLLFGKGATELNTIGLNTLNAVSGRVYRPFSVSKMGNLCFELGDPIRMSNDRMSVESYILERTFRGTQGFIDDISAEGVQSYTQKARNANTTYEKLQSKTAILRQDVDEVSSELTYQLDPTQGTPGGTHNSYAYQTAQEIGKRVTYTDFNYELDPTQAGGGGQHESYAHQTADEISQRVTTTTYNDFVNNTYGTFVTQTDSALTTKAEKTVGNFTTGFSCTLNATGHTWYKDNQQVMKVDGSGLHVTGLIEGSDILVGTMQNPITYISADGQEAIFANDTTSFSVDGNHTLASIGAGSITVDVNTSTDKTTIEIGNGPLSEVEEFLINNIEHFEFDDGYGAIVCEFEQEHDNGDNTTSSLLAIGSNTSGSGGIDKVAINGSEWVHIGVSTTDVRIGGTSDTTDLRIQATSSANINFKYVDGNHTVTKSLASILTDIVSADSTAGSAYTLASGIINNMLPGIVSTLNNHEQRITALENA